MSSRISRGGGCVQGCLIVIAVLVGIAILVVAGIAYTAHRHVQSLTAIPVTLPSPTTPEDQVKTSLASKIKETKEKLVGVSKKKPVKSVTKPGETKSKPADEPTVTEASLILNQDEANRFLRGQMPEDFRESVHFEMMDENKVRIRSPIEGSKLAKLIPSDMRSLKWYVGEKIKYVNLDAVISVRVQEGKMAFQVLEVKHPLDLPADTVTKVFEGASKSNASGTPISFPLDGEEVPIKALEITKDSLQLTFEKKGADSGTGEKKSQDGTNPTQSQ